MFLLGGWCLLVLQSAAAVEGFRFLGSSTLGQDPQTVNRLNGESFQQDALVTFNGAHICFISSHNADECLRRIPVCRVLGGRAYERVR